MRPNTRLIDFFHRVYAPLKLAGRQSEAKAVATAIKALTASLGHEATLQDFSLLGPTPTDLAGLHDYLRDLGIQSTTVRPDFREVMYLGRQIMVPIGDPTPNEIEQRAAEIRAGWSAAEALKRAGSNASRRWEAPTVAVHETTDGNSRSTPDS